jgi:transposase
MSDATCAGGFVPPDLTSFCRLDGLGLVVTGQRISAGRAVLACRVVGGGADGWCGECGCKAVVRDSVVRRLAHEPFGWRPTTLVVSLRRYRCDSCGRVWRQDMIAAAEPRATLSRRALAWALEALVVGHLSVARIAEALDVSWNTANDAVLAEGRRVLISDPGRFEGVRVLGVDEHVWRHTRAGDKYVTVIIDLTPVRDGTGPARLLDMVAGRTAGVFADWLAARPEAWRKRIEVVAMDGFTGYKTATATELPEATAVMDPFHVIRLAGDALDGGRRRVQQALHGHRGRRGDPLYTRDAPSTPAPTCSPTANGAASTTSSPPTTTPRWKSPGRSTSGWSPPTATPTASRADSSWPPSPPRSKLSPPASPSSPPSAAP